MGPSAAAARGGGGGGAGCGGSERGGAASACASRVLSRRCVRGAFADPCAQGRVGQGAGSGGRSLAGGGVAVSQCSHRSVEPTGERGRAREPQAAGSSWSMGTRDWAARAAVRWAPQLAPRAALLVLPLPLHLGSSSSPSWLLFCCQGCGSRDQVTSANARRQWVGVNPRSGEFAWGMGAVADCSFPATHHH